MTKATYYKARTNVNLPYEGAYVTISEGEVVPASSKLIKGLSKGALEEHFRPLVPGGGAVDGFGAWDVEQATAAPGEKRGSKDTAAGEKK